MQLGSTELSSLSEFRDHWPAGDTEFDGGFYRQSFFSDTEIQGWILDSETVFFPRSSRLDYTLVGLEGSSGALTVDAAFLMEYVEEMNEYGAGWELTLRGSTSGGIGAYLTSRFGMDEYLRESRDPSEEGSGYYIVTGGDHENIDPSSFPYSSTLLVVEGAGFDCCDFSNRTRFTRNEGLLYSGFNCKLQAESFPLTLNSYLYFSEQSAFLSIVPQISLESGRWSFSVDLGGVLESETGAGPRPLRFNGFRIEGSGDGGLRFNSLTALGGHIWKERGSEDLEDHAEDYIISEPVGEIARDYLYERTEYEEIVTFEVTHPRLAEAGVELFLDSYFDFDQRGHFFNFTKFTGELIWRLEDRFKLRFAVESEANRGVKELRSEMRYSF